MRDTPGPSLALLKIYIWEAQTSFDNPQFGITELFVLREKKADLRCAEPSVRNGHFFRKMGITFPGEIEALRTLGNRWKIEFYIWNDTFT